MSSDDTTLESIRENATRFGFADEYAYAEAIMNDDEGNYVISDEEYDLLQQIDEKRIAEAQALALIEKRKSVMETFTTPLVLRLQVAPYSKERIYGPFANATEAIAWLDSQAVPNLNFAFLPLRSPHRTRSTNDDWYGDHCDSDADFVAEVSISQQ